MRGPSIAVVIPTLCADERLAECLSSLKRQTLTGFEIQVVDNSGRGEARAAFDSRFPGVEWIENSRNVGFGAAVNQAVAASSREFIAVLNDDAVACPTWLEELCAVMSPRPGAGMCASAVRLYGAERLDSAGMLIGGDGSSKQRGHGEPPERYEREREALLPSGSAALYRRAMLEEIGLFDEDFFLYCEDTDLGLRARWAGWDCAYAPRAVVEHHYSHSAGRASALKAYYVERNRLFTLAKNFPGRLLLTAPLITAARYWWHAAFALGRRGAAARFREDGNGFAALAGIVLRAHWALAINARSLWRKRRAIRHSAKISPIDFTRLLKRHYISARQVAQL